MKEFIFILAICVTSFMLVSCGEPKAKPNPEFIIGDIVKTKVGGLKSQVVSASCMPGNDWCSYWIRIYIPNTEEGYETVRVAGYELETYP